MDWYVDRSQPAALTLLRQEITEFLGRHGIDDADAIDDAALIVEELLANACDHGEGPIWVCLEWGGESPTLAVHDMGPSFTLPTDAPTVQQHRGRGLWIVSKLATELAVAAKRDGGKAVHTVLPVRRVREESYDPPRRRVNALPELHEARPEGAFGRESFLRALVVQLSMAVEEQQGPVAAQRAVAQVGADVGGQMEQEYRAAIGALAGALDVERVAECLVRLKDAIGGTFKVVEIGDDRIVLVNSHCPFGDAVQRSPSLCRMTSSVFGGIAARSAGDAAVSLEERIALGDRNCRVVVHLGAGARDLVNAHHYSAAVPK
jgi:predicted ArsR family transcriptional regulator/anti-sigma regulatory factor (Ser/Thr protein kinase)